MYGVSSHHLTLGFRARADLGLIVWNAARDEFVDELPIEDDRIPAASKRLSGPINAVSTTPCRSGAGKWEARTHSSITTFMFLALKRISSFVRLCKMFSLLTSCDFSTA